MIHRSHYRFELILLIITSALGIFWMQLYVALLLWMILLGVMQVIHSVILASHYFHHQRIRSILIGYWIGVVIYLLALFNAEAFPNFHFFFPVIPLLMSTVPFLTTYLFRRPKNLPAPDFDFNRPGNTV